MKKTDGVKKTNKLNNDFGGDERRILTPNVISAKLKEAKKV
jgi:hypothetical protein